MEPINESNAAFTQADLDVEIKMLEAEVAADPAAAAVDEIAKNEEAAAGELMKSSADEWQSILVMLLGPAFSIVTPNWNVQKQEVEALAGSYAPVLAKYFPDVNGFGPEVGALLCTAAVFGPRLSIPRKAEEKPESAPADTVKSAPKKPVKSGLLSEDDR